MKIIFAAGLGAVLMVIVGLMIFTRPDAGIDPCQDAIGVGYCPSSQEGNIFDQIREGSRIR